MQRSQQKFKKKKRNSSTTVKISKIIYGRNKEKKSITTFHGIK